MTVATGLERLLDDPASWLRPGERVGLLSNPTGVDRRLRSTIDLLHDHPDIALTRLFGPEHGIRGDAQAGAPVDDATDPRTGLPETSLYRKDRSVADDAFLGIDTVVIDLQCVGARYYTYLATANSAARRAAAAGVRVLVLDRPNPIAWMGVFGNRVAPGAGSIVGLEGLPIAHGCTIGELLRHLARLDGRPEPGVVTMTGWERATRWESAGLPWVPPSPNLPTLTTACLYPATCLIEGTTLSEGRGTTLPFEQIGAPSLDGHALAESLAARGGFGCRFRPTTFVPTFSKQAGARCDGIQIHPDGEFQPATLALGPALLAECRRLMGEAFDWIRFGDVAFIDRLGGGPELRETVDTGGDIPAMLHRWRAESETFMAEIASDLLYGPLTLAELEEST
jgi:beta-N-acetylhexosaminidase